ncbi:rod shape-determining protein RodA [Algivirga pacifica]|uniref:Cell wall polymerase n=1 Tax=Algivirga pacifica TaxID=1162670 RepID=A0ABP9D6G4_9BACT
MQPRRNSIGKNVDWPLIFIYLGVVFLGWISIYAAVYQPDAPTSIFSLSLNSGKQLMWIGGAGVIITAIMVIDYKFFDTFSYVIYVAIILALVGVLLIGHTAGGNTSWFKIGFIRIQPSEFAKFAVALALSKYLSDTSVRLDRIGPNFFTAMTIIGIPTVLVLAQKDTGSAMVFSAFIFAIYREGFSSNYMVTGLTFVALFIVALAMHFYEDFHFWHVLLGLGILGGLMVYAFRKSLTQVFLIIALTVMSAGFVYSIGYILENVLRPYQTKRIEVLFKPEIEKRGVGYQGWQSKITIGSGGITGKGFLNGTQTKFEFVPEQSTDFIFCTVGEEFGFFGSLMVIGLFAALIIRLITVAERQRSRGSRVYGYCVAGIFFVHFMINMGMTIGVFPVIGIPLPFFSYGGSSLWAFTILLFTFIKLDAHRTQMMERG